MGRPLTGKVDLVAGAWIASVPRRRGENKRVQCSFPDESGARAWLLAQLDRLTQGLEAEPAPTEGRVRTIPTPATAPRPPSRSSAPVELEHIARRWHHERYVALHRGDADRTDAVLDDIEQHILPAFPTLTADVDTFREELTDWVRVLAGYPPLQDKSRFQLGGRLYAKKTVTNLLWIFSEILTFASLLGHDVPMTVRGGKAVPAATAGIHGMTKRGAVKRTPRLVSLELTVRIAAEMHVVHQTVLWLLRLAGLRISEAYGLIVANFLVDGDHGYLIVEAQAGDNQRLRDADEQIVTTRRKEKLKTEAGYRIIALPDQLSTLIRTIIATYHTLADGTVDYDAALIPPLRKEGSGKQGFRSALKTAVRRVGTGSDDIEDYVVPHDLRKWYCSDLAWSADVEAIVRRRSAGHRVGTDVFDVVYTLDRRRFADVRPAAVALEREVAAATDTLMVRTGRRPLYSVYSPERQAVIDARLEEAGWQVRCDAGTVTAAQAAAHLGMAVTSTRRLFEAGHIPAVRDGRGWAARLDDVISYRERFAGHRTIGDLADDLGVDYHAVYRTIERLALQPTIDASTGTLLLNSGDIGALTEEFDRLAALHLRALPVTDAAAALSTGHSMVHRWATTGRLDYDAESDATGRRFVTRASVDAERARRQPARAPSITVAELSRISGLDERAIAELARRGVVSRVGRARDQRLRLDSVRRWATGYRPDLLAAIP